MTPPVLFIVFNRPDLTERVMAAIREARPERLFVTADGPRDSKPGEADLCRRTREIATAVDWPCDVQTEFSETNLGCKLRVSSGITWAFSQVEELVILEDDCIPNASFFPFCAELLEHYRDDTRIMQISGSNLMAGVPSSEDASYFPSSRSHIWGWATWKRAWDCFDIEMTAWPYIRDHDRLSWVPMSRPALNSYLAQFERVYTGDLNSWGYIWALTMFANAGLSLVPRCNLVGNVGFGEGATHTIDPADPVANLPTAELEWPLRHPQILAPDAHWDNKLDSQTHRGLVERAVRKALRLSRKYLSRASDQ